MKIFTPQVKNYYPEEIHYSTTFSLDNKPYLINKTESVSNPYIKHILISNIFVYDDAQFLDIPENNYSFIAPRAQILLG